MAADFEFDPKVAVVTGGNKGIGYAICEGLLKANRDLQVVLTARDVLRGTEAVNRLIASMPEEDITERLTLILLDVTDAYSIKNAALDIKEKYGTISILINNAGIASKGGIFNEEVARKTIGTNYFGLRAVTEAFIPLMLSEGGRIVNISSRMGLLSKLGSTSNLFSRFTDPELSVIDLNGLMNEFIKASGTDILGEWPRNTYSVSKMGVTTLTKILSRNFSIMNNELLVNACCPGWVKTDMGGDKAPLLPNQGAEIAVMLALLPNGSQTGGMWFDNTYHDFDC